METITVEKMLNVIVRDMTYASCTVKWLSTLGYRQNFELVGDRLMCVQNKKFFKPSELTVDHLLKIDGLCYIYGLRHDNLCIKGIFVVYTDKDIII